VGVVAAEVGQDEALVQGAQLLGVEEVGEADCAVGAAEQPLVQDESAHAHEQGDEGQRIAVAREALDRPAFEQPSVDPLGGCGQRAFAP